MRNGPALPDERSRAAVGRPGIIGYHEHMRRGLSLKDLMKGLLDASQRPARGLAVAGLGLALSAAGPEGFPKERVPEVALLGRSNVGKSTLLNALVGRRRLAHTSRTPGKTRLAHFYRVERAGRRLRLVDLPGYGFARVSRDERARWRALVEGYLGARADLRVAVLLVDARRDPGEDAGL